MEPPAVEFSRSGFGLPAHSRGGGNRQRRGVRPHAGGGEVASVVVASAAPEARTARPSGPVGRLEARWGVASPRAGAVGRYGGGAGRSVVDSPARRHSVRSGVRAAAVGCAEFARGLGRRGPRIAAQVAGEESVPRDPS